MPGSTGEPRDWGRRRARAWCTPTWRAPDGPRHWPCRRTCHWWPASTTRCPGRPATTRRGPGMRHGGSTCSSPRGPSARAWAARIGLDDGRLRDGRSSVEGLSAAALPGFPSPRLTFADRLRGDKAPDVLIEILALIDAPPPAYLVGDGPLRGPLTRLIRARGLEAVVHLPGWSYEPARDIAQATVHVVPSREESWSQSAVLALGARRPGRRHRGRRPGAHPGRGPRRTATGHWPWPPRSAYLSCLRTSARPARPPVWFLAGPVGHLSADRWQPASYRVPAVPRGLTRAADQRPGRPAQRPSLPVVRVSPACLMSGCLWGAREMASRQGQSRRRLVPRRAWAEGVRG
jgi:hypothetical protein